MRKFFHFGYYKELYNRLSPKTKKILIVGLILIIASAGVFLALRKNIQVDNPVTSQSPYTVEKTENTSEKPEIKITEEEVASSTEEQFPDIQLAPGEFQWGVTMRPAALGRYSGSIWQKQIDFAKNLGTGWVRIGYDYNAPAKTSSNIIDYLVKNNMNPMLVVEQNPAHSGKNKYQSGYEDGVKVATLFKDEINFYQLANEGGAQVIKEPTLNGQEESHYNLDEYDRLKNYMLGLSNGIKKIDPEAKTVVTMSYTHTGYLDLITKDLNFDYIGIDWYDWMGSFADKKLDNGRLLVNKIRSFNKPLIFAEVNALPKIDPDTGKKTLVDNGAQKEIITKTAQWAWENRKFVRGFYVLELIDNVNTREHDFYGLISAQYVGNGKYDIGDTREAFGTYKDIISRLGK